MPLVTKTLPYGLISQSDLPVTTGDVDLNIWQATTIDLPLPTTITVAYLDLTIAVATPSIAVIGSQTLTEAGPAATLPGGDDWLPESASYGNGRLILGQKTSTDTYPPQTLTTVSANGLYPLEPTTTITIHAEHEAPSSTSAVVLSINNSLPTQTLRTLAVATTFPTLNSTATGTGVLSGTGSATGSVATGPPFFTAGAQSNSAPSMLLPLVALAMWAGRSFWR